MDSKRRCSRLGLFSGLALALAVTLAVRSVRANDTDRPAAEALFREAVNLVATGDFAAACPKFDAALALFPSAATAINVALCHEHEGRVASAWGMFRHAITLAKETDGPERRALLEARARDGAEAIESRLPKLILSLGSPEAAPPDLRVERDGVAYPAAGLGTPIPVDPGTTTIRASALGFAPFVAQVVAVEGETVALSIRLEPRVPPPPPPAPAPPPAMRRVAATPLPVAAVDGEGAELPAWAWISGGVGIGLGVVAIGFAVDDLAAIDALESRCDLDARPIRCDADYDVEADNARKNRSGALALAFGVSGAAALGAGLIGIIAGASAASSTDVALEVLPLAGPGVAGLGLGGSF